MGIVKLQIEAMKMDDRGDEAQSDPVTVYDILPWTAVESSCHQRPLALRDSWPVVDDAQ